MTKNIFKLLLIASVASLTIAKGLHISTRAIASTRNRLNTATPVQLASAAKVGAYAPGVLVSLGIMAL